MSDGILERDKHQALEIGWHGKTDVVERITRANIWLGQWDAQPVRLTAEEYLLNGVKVVVPEEETLFRFFATDDGLPIGESFNPATYTPIYNRDILDCVFPFVSDKGHRIVSCGSVGNRSKMFLVLAIAGLDTKDIDEKRKLAPFVNLFWSHDKSLEAYMIASAIMTVCQNTLMANLALGKEAIKARVKHTKNASTKIDNLEDGIAECANVFEAMALVMTQLVNAKLSLDKARALFAAFVAKGQGKAKLSARAFNTVERLVELFQRGTGNANKGESYLDALQAVTEYYTHESVGGENQWKQFVSSEVGSSSQAKVAFARLIQDDEKLAKALVVGEEALAEYAKLEKGKAKGKARK